MNFEKRTNDKAAYQEGKNREKKENRTTIVMKENQSKYTRQSRKVISSFTF